MPMRTELKQFVTLRQLSRENHYDFQVESKQLIGEAYTLGVEYYITKPLNKIEVVSVVRKVMERIRLERSIHDIQKSLNNVFQWEKPQLRTEPVQEGKR